MAQPALADTVILSPTPNEAWIEVNAPTCVTGLGRPINEAGLPVTLTLSNEQDQVLAKARVSGRSEAVGQKQRDDAPGYTFAVTHAILAPGRYRLATVGQLGNKFDPADVTLLQGPALLVCDPPVAQQTPPVELSTPPSDSGAWFASLPLIGGAIAALSSGQSGGGGGFSFPLFSAPRGPICF